MSAILLLIALLAGTNVEADETCGKKLDLAFLVDESTSICHGAASCPEWNAILEFCKSIVNSLTIGPDQSRVAFLTFTNEVEVEWDFTRYTDKATVFSAIGNVKYTGGEMTNYLSAADIILDVFNTLKGDRLFDQNILIIITDGAPNYPDVAWAAASTAIQADLVAVFIVCIAPGCHESCARGVASPPKQANETYFLLDDFLKLGQIRDNVVKKFCDWTLPQGIIDWVKKPNLVIV